MNLVRVLLIAGLAAAQPPALSSQPAAPAARYTVVTWTTEQGLPTNAIFDVEQTADGYMWFASFEGITRFDGVAFRTFGRADLPGVDRAEFSALAAGADGSLWAVGSPPGVLRLLNGRWSSLTARDGLLSDQVTALYMSRAGDLWIGSSKGVNRVSRDGRVEAIAPPAGIGEYRVNALAEDDDGTLWIGTPDGLLQHRDGRSAPVAGVGGAVTALLAAHDRSVIALEGTALTRIRQGAAEQLTLEGQLLPERITTISEDRGGTLWIGATNGLFVLDGSRATRAELGDGIADTLVNALLEDSEGNLWVTSPEAGLVRLRRESFTTLSTSEGLPLDLVYNVTGDGAGGQWIATIGGVAHRTSSGLALYTRENGALPINTARDVLQTRNGAVWVATTAGLTRLAPGRPATYTTHDGLSDDRQRVLLEDRAGALWIGGYAGLTQLHDGQLRAYGPSDGVTDGYVLSLFEDHTGTLWVGTQSAGLLRRRAAGRFVTAGDAFERQPIFHISEDADGTLWIGTSRGLARLRGDDVRYFTVREGLHSNTIFHALDDGAGHLWLSSPAGLARVSRASLDAVADRRERLLAVRQFGRADGMASRESTQIARGWRSPDGRLWFPTPAGLASVDPRSIQRNAVAPAVHIEAVLADGAPFDPAAPIDLPAGTRKIDLQYTSPSFVSPAQLRFRYRLDGFDDDWVDGGGRRSTSYTNLAPGRYTFRAQARNEDGVWSENAAAVAVTLLPQVWQTWPFLGFLGIAAAALVFGIHRLRVRAVERGMREEMLRAMSLHDELTGLYNRRGFLALADQQVRAIPRSQRGFALVFIDMDGMKRINDSLGHGEGDRALRDVAAVLRSTFRDSDIIGRIGGDEFAVLVPDDPQRPGTSAVDAACARLDTVVARHNAATTRPYQLSLSIGVGHCDAASPAPLEAIIEAADRNMFVHKRQKGVARK